MVENPNFRELLIYVSGGTCTEQDIPHRTKLTNDIMEAWKQERKAFADDMKVCLTMFCFTHCDLYVLMSHNRMPLEGFRSRWMLGATQTLHHFLA